MNDVVKQPSKWQSRKLIVAFVVWSAFIVLVWFGKVGASVLENVTIFIWAAYFAANVGDKFASK